MKTAVSKVWTGACWVDAMLKTHAKVVEYKDGKSVYDILKPLEPYTTGTIQQPFTVQNPRAVNKTTIASDGIHIGTGAYEVHYGKDFIVNKYGEVETVYGLPKEGGTLVTEGKARTLAQEEIAKYDFIKIVEELPDEGLPNRIYLVPHEAEEGSNDLFDMWLWVNDAWEFEGTKSAEIDNTLYVKFTDYATANKAGVVKAGAGLGMSKTDGGSLYVVGATLAQINAGASNSAPLTTNNIRYAVKKGVTTNTETLTDEEKAAACGWLGAVPSVTTADSYQRIYGISPSGEPYIFKVGEIPIGYTIAKRLANGGLLVPETPEGDKHATSKKYVDTNKGTKLYKHNITGVSGTATTGETITNIVLVSTDAASITGDGETALSLLYLDSINSYIPYYGKITHILDYFMNQVTVQFHNRLNGGDVESMILDVENMVDTVTAL